MNAVVATLFSEHPYIPALLALAPAGASPEDGQPIQFAESTPSAAWRG